MSKSLLQFAQLMTASNEQLFDRYINVKLTRDKPASVNKLAGGAVPRTRTEILKDGFQIITPKTGCKPNITVAGRIIPSEAVCNITLTIFNILDNVDTMAYNWCEIEAGYLNSGIHMNFTGRITNCYMAKPNPNGELVVGVTTANVTELYGSGDFAVEFPKNVMTTAELVKTCINAMTGARDELVDTKTAASRTAAVVASIPKYWQTKIFTVGKATRYFRSALECIAWLNSLFASYVYNTGYAQSFGMAPMGDAEKLSRANLCPLMLGFDLQGNLCITNTFSEANPTSVKALKAIGSAVLTSTSSATITAPFNPDIKPGDVIAVNSKYFKTRLNTEIAREKYDSLGSLWNVVSMEFTFSTHTSNTMTLKLNNLNNKLNIAGG